MAGLQEEDFSSAFDECSEREVHADWLRESNKVMVLSGVWVQVSKKAAFSFVFIPSFVLE